MSLLLTLVLTFNIFLSIAGNPIDFTAADDELFERALLLNALETETFADVEPAEYRLKTTIYPSLYQIELEPFLDVVSGNEKPFSFKGNVKITLKANKTGEKEIELHARNLVISKITLKDDKAANVEIDQFTFQNETEKVKIPVKSELKTNVDYLLEIDYTGTLDDSMKGFYRSHYNENGKKVWLASTQFQSTDFRRAVPSFDEPHFKAKFQVNIIRPQGYKLSISNTMLERQEPIAETSKVKEIFKTTPVMSTYLMAFIVQMFNGKQTTDKSYGVWARPEAESQLAYSFSVGEKLLKEMGTWIDYPFNKVPEIQKLDMIAVPDFSAGAMENWGAMTYREANLLWDEKESSVRNKQSIGAVLTHEIAHLWFGDLVTCDWWGVTWLNEGFARYFQTFGTHLVEKDWNLPEQFVVDQLHGALSSDSVTSTHPLTNPNVFTPNQCAAMFSGGITYSKGASVIRMMEHHMKTATFKSALRKYIKAHEYKTVQPQNLFDAFNSEAPTAKVQETFEAWTNQSGYPYLTVTSFENNTVKVSQKRFMLNNKDHSDKTRWSIPITYANREEHFSETATRLTYPNTQTTDFSIKLPENGTLGFYLLNVQQVGFYRVNYDEENWKNIRTALKSENHGKIHLLNRAMIVDDLFNFARNGILSYDFVMSIVDYVREEKNYIPWVPMFNGLSYLSRRIGLNSDYERFRKHILYLTEPLYKHLGFDVKSGESHIDTLSRTNLLNWMCKHGHEECIAKSKEEFKKLMTNDTYYVNANIRIPVYCNAIRHGNNTEYEFLWKKYMTTNVAAEQINVLNTLGCTKEQKLINNLLDKVLTEDIRTQDKSTAFSNAYTSNHENVDLVFNYLTENWQKWEKVMGSVGSAMSSLADRFTTEEQVKKMEDFAKTSGLGDNNVRLITNAAASARTNFKWDQERLGEVREYFKVLDNNSATSISLSFSLILVTIVTFFYNMY
ncbi:membrane alanyl aminopeptidase-like [Culicoides brevitarsis]|uniref:membrane alanyl aminopeptidase-like n=1 Tax=Culicoides brevitarsis TaxID=469753 RepID=UPI00307BCD29